MNEEAVLLRRQRVLVAIQEVQRDFLHLFNGESAIYFDSRHGVVKPLHVLAKLERTVTEGARILVDHVANVILRIEERDLRFGFGNKNTVEIRYSPTRHGYCLRAVLMYAPLDSTFRAMGAQVYVAI